MHIEIWKKNLQSHGGLINTRKQINEDMVVKVVLGKIMRKHLPDLALCESHVNLAN